MDGVVVHHFIALGRAAGIDISRDTWPLGKTGIKDITGLSKDAFDALVIAGGAELWATMPAFPWFKTFFAALENIAPVYYLSAPEYGAGCVAGKVKWIEAIHGAGYDRFILTRHKELFAQPNHLLVDDTPKNVETFITQGGNAVLFHQPWNGHNDPAPDLLCLQEIDKLLHRQQLG
jgi:5'(3')-deoxyribonucleotidase